jgi:hypothetical protein
MLHTPLYPPPLSLSYATFSTINKFPSCALCQEGRNEPEPFTAWMIVISQRLVFCLFNKITTIKANKYNYYFSKPLSSCQQFDVLFASVCRIIKLILQYKRMDHLEDSDICPIKKAWAVHGLDSFGYV